MGLCLNLQGWRFHYLSGLLSQWETTVVVKATIAGQMFCVLCCPALPFAFHHVLMLVCQSECG